MRADLVVQWQVARHRARVSTGAPLDLLGATWGPWWQFARGRRLPAACFRPRPAVDAALLEITRRDPPLVAAADFDRYAAWLAGEFGRGPDAPQIEVPDWADRFHGRR